MCCDGLTIDRFMSAHGMVVELRGELDAYNAPEVAATLAGVIDDSDGDIAIDVEGVEFFDSAGVRLLVELSRGLKAVNRRLSLVNPSPIFARITELLGSAATAADGPAIVAGPSCRDVVSPFSGVGGPASRKVAAR